MNADRDGLNPSRSCEKCGGTEIRVFWHRTDWANSTSKRKGCSYGDNAQPSGEHLHCYCQTCHYDFFEDVIANA